MAESDIPAMSESLELPEDIKRAESDIPAMSESLELPEDIKRVEPDIPAMPGMPEGLELPEDIKRAVFEEFGDESEFVPSLIAELRSRLLQLPEDMRTSDLSDRNLIRFLRGKKYNVDKTYSTMVKNFEFRQLHPEWFQVEPEEVEVFAHMVKILRTRDQFHRRIVMLLPFKGLTVVTKEFMAKYPSAMTRFRLWLFEQLSHDPYAQLGGVVLIMSFQNMSFWDSMTFSKLATLYEHTETIRFLTTCVGMRLKLMMGFEEPMVVTVLWGAISLVLSEKLKKRFNFCGTNYGMLGEKIRDLSILPTCLGGSATDDFMEENWLRDELMVELGASSER